MKKIASSLFLSLILVSSFLLSACGNNSGDDQITINVYNWGDYIAEETITNFEEATGIQVNYELFDSNEAMYAKLKSGAVAYDVLIPSDYMIQKLLTEEMLLPLNYENIPNYSHIGDDYKDLDYDPTNAYSIPYMWGTLGIVYNTTMVTEPVDSWSILFDPAYSGQIIMKDSVRDSFVPALKLQGASINSTDKLEWEEALSTLMEQKAIIQGYMADEVRDKMIGEEAALSIMYSGEAVLTLEENENLAYAVPQEGSNKWFDAMVIPNTSTQKEAAEAFINYMCDIDVAYANADYIGYSTPIPEARDLLDDSVKNDPVAYPDSSVLSNCEVFLDLGKDMTDFTNEKWNMLKAY